MVDCRTGELVPVYAVVLGDLVLTSWVLFALLNYRVKRVSCCLEDLNAFLGDVRTFATDFLFKS